MYKLYNATIELTRKCNAKCKHCIVDAGKAKNEELTNDEIIKLLEECADLGCETAIFTGGEALLRQEWPLFIQKATALGMQTVLMSNGLKINDDVISVLKLFNVSVGMSLDGPDAETHDHIRGVKGIFDNFVEVAKKLVENDVYLSVPTTVMKSNFDKLDAIRDLLIDLKVPSWQIQVVKPANRLLEEELLTPEQYYKLAEKIAEYREKYSDDINIVEADCIGYNSILTPKLYLQEWRGCECGIYSVSIESDGNVKGCPNMNNSEGNIKERPFKEIWLDHNSFSYNRKPTVDNLKGYCRECKHKYVCRGGCPTNAIDKATDTTYCLYHIENM